MSTDVFEKYYAELASHMGLGVPPELVASAPCECAKHATGLQFLPEEVRYTGMRTPDMIAAENTAMGAGAGAGSGAGAASGSADAMAVDEEIGGGSGPVVGVSGSAGGAGASHGGFGGSARGSDMMVEDPQSGQLQQQRHSEHNTRAGARAGEWQSSSGRAEQWHAQGSGHLRSVETGSSSGFGYDGTERRQVAGSSSASASASTGHASAPQADSWQANEGRQRMDGSEPVMRREGRGGFFGSAADG